MLTNMGKWQSVNQETSSARRKKKLFLKVSLLFFGVNVKVLKRTSSQRRVVLILRNDFSTSCGNHNSENESKLVFIADN